MTANGHVIAGCGYDAGAFWLVCSCGWNLACEEGRNPRLYVLTEHGHHVSAHSASAAGADSECGYTWGLPQTHEEHRCTLIGAHRVHICVVCSTSISRAVDDAETPACACPDEAVLARVLGDARLYDSLLETEKGDTAVGSAVADFRALFERAQDLWKRGNLPALTELLEGRAQDRAAHRRARIERRRSDTSNESDT